MNEQPRFTITSLNQDAASRIQLCIDNKTKPPGALGALEPLALQLALIQGGGKIRVERPIMLVFAADHGIAEQGVSIAPPEVTGQMVRNFLSGGAAINCFCRTVDMKLEVIDAGILAAIDDPRLTVQRLGAGTANFSQESAMGLSQVYEGIELGRGLAKAHVKSGATLIGLGEMGIGNTSSASALMAASLDLNSTVCVGRGTGVDDQALSRKRSLIDQALQRHGRAREVYDRLAAYGGFEIVQMVGAMLGAAEAGAVILVDGFIASVAALYATEIAPASRGYMVFCHRSQEQAHSRLLEALNAKPLLDLGLRLGEGTGAALALPLIRAAASFYNDMASFDHAGIRPV